MEKIKAIFFDLDDTLVDSRKAEHDASIEFKKQFKEFENVDDENFAKLWHEVASEQYERYSRKEVTYERQKIDRIIVFFSKFNIAKEEIEASELFKKYLKLYENNWKAFKGAKEILEILKSKYKLGIITNGDGIQQRNKIKLTGIGNYFSELIISGEVDVSKPNNKVFEIACNKLNVSPKECVMIGDNFKLDIQGAQNYGLKAIWINRRNEGFEFKNQIKELNELLGIL